LLPFPFSSDLSECQSWRLLQFSDFQPEIQAILLGRFQKELGDIRYRHRIAPAVSDNLPGQFKEFS